MKKIFLIILLVMILPVNVFANENTEDIVTLSNCVDSESARFLLGVSEIKVKFLGIQLEEKVIDNENDEINGSFVSDYVCSSLKNAKTIKIQYEPNAERQDKYGRIQAWIFVDDILLQEDLIKNGYARAMYLEDNYLYTDKLKEAQQYAKENDLGIWMNKEEEVVVEEKKEEKSKSIIDIIIDFFASIFRAIRDFIDSIINSL